MNRKHIILIFAALLGVFSSCSFFEEYPSTSLVDENVYETRESAESALNGLYASMYSIYMHNSYSFVFMNASPYRGWTRTPIDSWLQHTLYSNDGSNTTIYQSIYKAIGRANLFISGIAKADLDKDFCRELEAEGHFLRAFLYFEAVRLWGDVPLVLDPVVSIDQVSIPRTAYQKVYKAILDDLDFAEANMRDYDSQDRYCHGQSHVCNYAATALKARVYNQIACYMESPYDQWFNVQEKPERYPDFSECGIERGNVQKAWELSLESAKKVLEEGPYELESDYRNLFRWDPKNHPEDYLSRERIFVITVTPQTSSNAWCSWSMPKYIGNDTGNNGNQLKQRPSRYTWELWCEKYGGSQERGSQSSLGGEYFYYSGCPDPRLDASYFHTTYTTSTSDADRTLKEFHCYPYCVGEAKEENYVAYYNSSTAYEPGYACVPIYKKCYSASYQGNGTGGDADFYLMRFAEVYLLAAEASASLGDLEKACEYVNTILERARYSVDNPENPSDEPHDWEASDYTKETLIDAIMLERVFEMDHEMHTWHDSHRRGATYLVNKIAKPRNAFLQEPANLRYFQSSYNKQGQIMVEDVQTARKGLLLAFPEYELLHNTALSYRSQNDFYIQ